MSLKTPALQHANNNYYLNTGGIQPGYASGYAQPPQPPTALALQPITSWQSLLRYELFILLVWFFVDMARWYLQRRSPNAKKFHKCLCWGVLVGALVGGLLFWLVVDVWFYKAFHAPVGVGGGTTGNGTVAVATPVVATSPGRNGGFRWIE